jgi:PAS domain S-box-containing protein
VVDNLNEGLWLLDRDARTTFANPRLGEMLGFTPDEMMGRTLFSFMDEAGVSRCREYMDRHPQNIREACDFELLRKDGSRLCTSLSTAQILDERGCYAGVVAGVMDITERLALEREILNVGKREQRRIGEDLHDGLGQQLTGIELMCSSLHDDLCATQPKLKDQTAKMGSFLREAIRQTRLLAHDSIGFNLSAHGLPIALAEFAKNISSMGRVQCGFHCPSPVSFDNPDIADHFYRIAQESVHNAVKHSQAGHVTILLTQQGETRLHISDDGKGLPQSPTPNHGMGMQVMKHRASIMGAQLNVESKPGQGVSVICIWRQKESKALNGKTGVCQP